VAQIHASSKQKSAARRVSLAFLQTCRASEASFRASLSSPQDGTIRLDPIARWRASRGAEFGRAILPLQVDDSQFKRDDSQRNVSFGTLVSIKECALNGLRGISTVMKCKRKSCPTAIPSSARLCPTCSTDNGYPNVRKAKEEAAALRSRFKAAQRNATANGCLDVFQRLCELSADSVAVIATNFRKALTLLSDASERHQNFYRLVYAGAKTPSQNRFDDVRGIADELMFPNYRDNITFAALSVNDVGSWYYGPVHLALAEFAISERATVFHENSLYFCERHALGVHKPIPPGYRAVWKQRANVAGAKLESNLKPTMTPIDLQEIILNSEDRPDADFIEVHIYEGFTRESVRKVTVKAGAAGDDEIMKSLIEKECHRAGIAFEEVA
jgi:hypothetical protein